MIQQESTLSHNLSRSVEQPTSSSIESLAKKYGAVAVSAVRQYGNLGPFRPVDRGSFKGVRIFDILLRSEQVLCCSAVMPGDTSNNLYGRWGVIVADGDIETAFPYDAMTSVVNGKITSEFNDRIVDAPIDEQIASAIYARGDYNEINVRAKKIAGLYYCLDECEGEDELEILSPATQALLDKINSPSFLLKNGKFYLFKPQDGITNIGSNDEVSPEEITDFSVDIDSDLRESMIAALVDKLTLAPRNAISSGYQRGSFAYQYRDGDIKKLRAFITEHEQLIERYGKESLRTYGAIALFAFAEAIRDEDILTSIDAEEKAMSVFDYQTYKALISRITLNGNLRITRSDFEHYLKTGQLPPYIDDHWM